MQGYREQRRRDGFAAAVIERNSHGASVSIRTGFSVGVETTPIALPSRETIGEPDMPPTIRFFGSKSSRESLAV
jgi:hypothetical protein